MERKLKGVFVPANIWECKELSITERFLIAEINRLDLTEGCRETNKYFAEFLNLTQSRISVIINNLVKRGFLYSTIKYKDNKEVENRILSVNKTILNIN